MSNEVNKPLARMTKAELLVEAAAAEVEIAEGATNAEIVALIEAQRAASDWTPARVREDGVNVSADGLPLNHRLRAEALVQRGATEDPEGVISKELIEDTKARLEAEAAETTPQGDQGQE